MRENQEKNVLGKHVTLGFYELISPMTAERVKIAGADTRVSAASAQEVRHTISLKGSSTNGRISDSELDFESPSTKKLARFKNYALCFFE